MRATHMALGALLAGGVAVGVAVSHAETKIVDGRPQLVVASVGKTRRVYELPVVTRCVRVGVPAAVVGAGIGYFATQGGSLAAVFFGALTLGALSAGWREDWPEKFGRAGANALASDSLLHGLVGGLFGAATAAHLAKHHPRYPQRLQPPEPADAC